MGKLFSTAFGEGFPWQNAASAHVVNATTATIAAKAVDKRAMVTRACERCEVRCIRGTEATTALQNTSRKTSPRGKPYLCQHTTPTPCSLQPQARWLTTRTLVLALREVLIRLLAVLMLALSKRKRRLCLLIAVTVMKKAPSPPARRYGCIGACVQVIAPYVLAATRLAGQATRCTT